MICQSCGMTIGVDCFNPQECMAITQDMAARAEQMQLQENERAHDIQIRDEHIANLRAELKACEGKLARVTEDRNGLLSTEEYLNGERDQAHSLLRKIVERWDAPMSISGSEEMQAAINEARKAIE